MKLPKRLYDDWLAETRFNYRWWRQHDRKRERERMKPGPVTYYFPQENGKYLKRDEGGRTLGLVER